MAPKQNKQKRLTEIWQYKHSLEERTRQKVRVRLFNYSEGKRLARLARERAAKKQTKLTQFFVSSRQRAWLNMTASDEEYIFSMLEFMGYPHD